MAEIECLDDDELERATGGVDAVDEGRIYHFFGGMLFIYRPCTPEHPETINYGVLEDKDATINDTVFCMVNTTNAKTVPRTSIDELKDVPVSTLLECNIMPDKDALFGE